MQKANSILRITALALLGLCFPLAGFWLGGALGLGAGLVLLAGLLFLLGWVLVHVTLWRRSGVYTYIGQPAGPPALRDTKMKDFDEKQLARLAGLGLQDAHITSRDGLRLHAYYLPAPNAAERRCVVLAHGYGWRALQMADYALWWRHTYGVHVLMPDARAHGQSEGRYTGMGWPDRLDMLDWCGWLCGKLGHDIRIALHGISMGGATVMMAGGEKLPPQIKFLAEDCGYTSAWDELAHQLYARARLPAFPFLPLANFWCRLLAGYSLRDASALRQAAHTNLPMLFIHGEADHFVPTRMVYPLYKAAPSAHKELILIPGAGHIEAFWTDEQGQIKEALARYMRQYMGPQSTI